MGEKTLPVIRKYVDSVVAVKEESIAGAILKFIERKKLVVEGAGAVPLAAAMEDRLPTDVRKAVFVVSGGNIDVTTLDRVLRLGLIKEGRVIRVETVIPDVPGSLSRLSAEVASLKANILQIFHKRAAADVPVGRACIDMLLEVEGPEHAGRVRAHLKEKGYEL